MSLRHSGTQYPAVLLTTWFTPPLAPSLHHGIHPIAPSNEDDGCPLSIRWNRPCALSALCIYDIGDFTRTQLAWIKRPGQGPFESHKCRSGRDQIEDFQGPGRRAPPKYSPHSFSPSHLGAHP